MGNIETTERNQKHELAPQNLSSVLSRLQTMNYYSLFELYHKDHVMYFHLINYDYFRETQSVHTQENSHFWIPRLQVILYKIYYKSTRDLHYLQKQFSDHKIIHLHLLNQSQNQQQHLMNHETSQLFVIRPWKKLTFKKAFQDVFSKICLECSIHASVLSTTNSTSTPDIQQQQQQQIYPISLLEQQQQQQNEVMKCDICLDRQAQITLCCCMSSYCQQCLQEWNRRQTNCPVCRKPIDVNQSTSDSLCFENVVDYPLNRQQVVDVVMQYIEHKM